MKMCGRLRIYEYDNFTVELFDKSEFGRVSVNE